MRGQASVKLVLFRSQCQTSVCWLLLNVQLTSASWLINNFEVFCRVIQQKGLITEWVFLDKLACSSYITSTLHFYILGYYLFYVSNESVNCKLFCTYSEAGQRSLVRRLLFWYIYTTFLHPWLLSLLSMIGVEVPNVNSFVLIVRPPEYSDLTFTFVTENVWEKRQTPGVF